MSTGKSVLCNLCAVINLLLRLVTDGCAQGWSASYVRLGPQTVILFISMEIARKWAGLAAL